jgi:hypothetical protein
MICMSLNCRGMGSSSKNLALKHIVEIHKPSIIMLQESMGEGGKLVTDLGRLFAGWDFSYLDARG